MKILDSDISKDTKDEVLRFWTLPRNTPVKPSIELEEDPQEDYGSVSRPSASTLRKKDHPREAGEEEAMSETIKGLK